ncbi:ribonuclease P protein component [Patescibacteria group bacterium]|nr:ribonuclease P protein component [Patescibacteria group bacterium]
MLSKDKKINTELFNKIITSGKKKYFKYFYFLILEDKKQEKSHITCVAPKKQFKKAVDRNEVKRKFMAIIKDLYNTIPPSYNIIVFLKKEIIELKPQELKKEIKDSISKLI